MKQKQKFYLSRVLIVFLIIISGLSLLRTQIYRVKPGSHISDDVQTDLIAMASTSLRTDDVPVGALVIYDDKIIGKGNNTVFRDGNIAGHAEINAINDAIDALGVDAFLELDRDRLSIISTYEPCEMCRGMFVHYRIFNVTFLKGKSWLRWVKNDRAALLYEWHKTQSGDGHLQDSLFMLHPGYPGKR